MLTAEIQHAEGARYRACLVLVPGLWAGPAAWRGFAAYLAHRGWESHMLDLRGQGGLAARGAAVAEYAGSLPAPAVLIGHDAGAPAALAAAAARLPAALVLLAPVLPGSRGLRGLVGRPGSVLALLRGRPVARPDVAALARAWGETGAAALRLAATLAACEDAAVVREVAWRRRASVPAVRAPVLLLGGGRDPLLTPDAAAAVARGIGAEHQTLATAGHWPMAGPGWERAVDLVHRWLVQRLGEPLLERYAEAMAERDAEEGE
jgi:pimeloyl-ACP methyl ester carboxylesterase